MAYGSELPMDINAADNIRAEMSLLFVLYSVLL